MNNDNHDKDLMQFESERYLKNRCKSHEKRDKGLFEDLGPEDLGCMDLGDHEKVSWMMETIQMIIIIVAITGIVLWII